MIVIKVRENGILVDGHAGYAEHGKDIVCAGVSVLAQNLISSLEALTEDRIRHHVEPGHISIEYENLSERGMLLVDSFFIGVSSISESYGVDYVQII